MKEAVSRTTYAANWASQIHIYNWRKKSAGMDSQELKRLKELEEENRKLKQLYAELL
jgi:hypothetical protein